MSWIILAIFWNPQPVKRNRSAKLPDRQTPDVCSCIQSLANNVKGKKHNHDEERQGLLQGWKAIAAFLGQHVATAQSWARSGMPVSRQGRYAVAEREALRRWIGEQSGMKAPAHIATDDADLAAGLKASIAAVRRKRRIAA